MTRGSVKPEEIWIRRQDIEKDGLHLTLHIRWNIQEEQTTNPDDGETYAEWIYEDEELNIKPSQLKLDNSGDLQTQINAWLGKHKADLLNAAYQMKALRTNQNPVSKYSDDIRIAYEQLSNISDMDYSQVEAYISNNVTDLISARDYLVLLSKVVLGLIKVVDFKDDAF